jgi:hypothetical protein
MEVTMAGREPSITRRRVLGAAAAVPIAACIPIPALLAAAPDRRLWDRRLTRYRWLAARAERAATSGWFREANYRYYRDVAVAEARFGSRKEAERSPEGTKLWDAIWGRMVDAENLYWEQCSAPMIKAAVTLILTPAPDAEALIAKLRVMRERELETLEDMPRHPLELLEEDVTRLSH